MVHQSGKTVLHTNISEVAFGFPGDFAPWLFTAASVFQRDVNHDGVVVTFDAKMVGHVGRGMEIGARTSRAPNVVDHTGTFMNMMQVRVRTSVIVESTGPSAIPFSDELRQGFRSSAPRTACTSRPDMRL